MDPTQENEALAAAIVAFFKNEFGEYGEDVVIEPDLERGGYLIETSAGASFTFEISEPTKAAVARAYFEHIRSIYQFDLDHWFTNSLLDGGRLISRREKQEARRRLAIMDAWARRHLAA